MSGEAFVSEADLGSEYILQRSMSICLFNPLKPPTTFSAA
jgi:hypothetical protein